MRIADRIRTCIRPVWNALTAIPPKRMLLSAVVMLVILGMVGIPASRVLPPVRTGEVFGEIHWYDTNSR